MAEIGGDPAMEEDRGALVQNLIDTINEIASISDYRCAVKKQYCNLARRLKLLTPMFEEIRDSKEEVSQDTLNALVSFMEALESAKELLRFGSESSKIYLIMTSDRDRPGPETICELVEPEGGDGAAAPAAAMDTPAAMVGHAVPGGSHYIDRKVLSLREKES